MTAVIAFQVFLWAMITFWIVLGGYVLHISGDLKPAWKKTKDLAIELSLLGPFLIPLVVVLICETLGG
jgi:hypothetical protein